MPSPWRGPTKCLCCCCFGLCFWWSRFSKPRRVSFDVLNDWWWPSGLTHLRPGHDQARGEGPNDVDVAHTYKHKIVNHSHALVLVITSPFSFFTLRIMVWKRCYCRYYSPEATKMSPKLVCLISFGSILNCLHEARFGHQRSIEGGSVSSFAVVITTLACWMYHSGFFIVACPSVSVLLMRDGGDHSLILFLAANVKRNWHDDRSLWLWVASPHIGAA